jgi:iron uptake system component EfeO
MTQRSGALVLAVALCGFAACSNEEDAADTGGDFEEQATVDVKAFVDSQLSKLVSASEELQDAAPEPDEDGWNDSDDQEAWNEMAAAWKKARTAYENVEGPIATLFAGLDVSADARYDAFLEEDGADDDLFDDEIVTGMHGIERILWSSKTPDYVITFEEKLDGYKAAAFPKTEAEADAFKNKLAQRLVDDAKKMKEDYATVALEVGTAFQGIAASTREQSEKTNKAATGEDESRYAQNTLADMRANLNGANEVYKAFKAWIEDTGGDTQAIERGFAQLKAAYDEVEGDALPKVPEGFNPDKPTEDDLKTPYGKLWKLLADETDLENEQSLVSIIDSAARGMGIEGIEEE